jgi:molecular chaperone Hsp31 and glyoxalase 3
MIKKILGIAPTKQGKGYIPSPLGRMLGVDKVTGYKPADIDTTYNGDKKILVLCTEKRYFEMTNGNLFSTGNNVQETAVPLMHLVDAGFDFDVVTSTGSKAVLEEWSEPKKDERVLSFMKNHEDKFNNPLSLEKVVTGGQLNDSSKYLAVFIPGGHGSMVGLPEDENVGELIRWVKDSNRYMIAVCHGPAALMAATVNSTEPHPYNGYAMAIFPDSYDKQSPSLGYLPGHLPWYQCEKLAEQGLTFVNDKITGCVHVDRKLYSGDSPRACDELGKTTARDLLKEFAN